MIVLIPFFFRKPFLTGDFPKYRPRVYSHMQKQGFGMGFRYYRGKSCHLGIT